jgi:hypothetical protein
MKFKDPEGIDVSKLIVFIIGMTVALLIFSQLAPTITGALVSANYTVNPIAGALVVLIPVVFVAVILLQTLKGLK